MLFIAYRQATSAPRVPMIEKKKAVSMPQVPTRAAANGNRKTVRVRQGWGREELYSRIFLNLENAIKNKIFLRWQLK